MRRYSFTPMLGWSFSRYDKFSQCKRLYYYEYYGKYDKEFPPGKITLLKSLTSIPLEIGNLVHKTISVLLYRLRKNTAPIDVANVLNYSYRLVDEAIKMKTFQEVYYHKLEAISADEIKGRVENCLRSFFASEWYKWLIEDAIIQRAGWVIEPEDYGELRIDGRKAYCRVDFLSPAANGSFYVFDWKTGKVGIERDTQQMKGYALYAMSLFNATTEQVKPVVVYLGDHYEELSHSFTEGDLAELATQVAVETEEMYQYCENIEENIPKAKTLFSQEEGNLCPYCNYRELCGK